jgi:hypothetical protein
VPNDRSSVPGQPRLLKHPPAFAERLPSSLPPQQPHALVRAVLSADVVAVVVCLVAAAMLWLAFRRRAAPLPPPSPSKKRA